MGFASSRHEAEGIDIEHSIPGLAADTAGLRRRDRIVQVDDRPVRSMTDLMEILADHDAGDEIVVHYVRNRSGRTTKVTLGSRP